MDWWTVGNVGCVFFLLSSFPRAVISDYIRCHSVPIEIHGKYTHLNELWLVAEYLQAVAIHQYSEWRSVSNVKKVERAPLQFRHHQIMSTDTWCSRLCRVSRRESREEKSPYRRQDGVQQHPAQLLHHPVFHLRRGERTRVNFKSRLVGEKYVMSWRVFVCVIDSFAISKRPPWVNYTQPTRA